MKTILIFLAVAFLAMVIALPIYLGPDDISNCMKLEESGPCRKVDAIITVSGGDTKARTDEAIKYYKSGWSELIIFSGAALDKTGTSNAQAMRQQALKSGVPDSNIMVEEFSNNTAENAENTAQLVQQMSLSRVMLVTSAYHQRRASIEFSKRLGESVQIVNHPVASDSQWSSWWWLTPYGWWLGIGEVIKIILAGIV